MDIGAPMAPIEIAIDVDTIRAAHRRIAASVLLTPVLTSAQLDAATGATLFFKCENLQRVGAFKARGACNAVLSLAADVAARGVVTHSSGNHGAALAWAAARRRIPAWVIMPDNAPAVKQAAVKGFGAQIRFCTPTLVAREAACADVQRETGASLVHPYDDWQVIAGQGTAALELLEQVPDLDIVIVPVGGGGLLSGTVIAAKAMQGSIVVYGAEPAGADDAYRSLREGRLLTQTDPHTIADGLRSSLGAKTFAVLSRMVDGIGTASEASIIRAMRTTWENLKVIVEPSSAVPLAAILEDRFEIVGKRVGVILTGGNVDLDRMPWQS
jgi:threonine dehydratase